jgi:hypothetical protein
MNNPPAFPHTVEYKGSDCGGIVPHGGMTLRDYFAAKAMPQCFEVSTTTDIAAKEAYRMADAMLKAREE